MTAKVSLIKTPHCTAVVTVRETVQIRTRGRLTNPLLFN